MKKEKPAKDKKTDLYSVTEVGALVESLLKEIKTIGENHSGLDKRLGDIEVEVHGNSEKLTMLQLVSGLTKDKVTHLDNRVSLLDKKVSQLDQKVSHLDESVGEVDRKVSRFGEELKSEIRGLGNRLTSVETRG